MFIPHDTIMHLVKDYGAGLVGAVAFGECMGLPVPAEAALVIASVYAGTSGELDIAALVAAAAGGAILGQMAGYGIGRSLGVAALRRWGPRIGLTDDRVLLGRYLFRHHGGKVIILGRFAAFLRALGALLAGANGMPWRRFLVADVVGGCLWAAVYGFGAYALGHQMEAYARSGAVILGVVAIVGVGAAFLAIRHSERRLIAVARQEERAA